MKSIFLLLFTTALFSTFSGQAQKLVSNRESIDKTEDSLQAAMDTFSSCIVDADTKICIDNLVSNATTAYRKYLIAGMLYEIDTFQSFKLHKEAYLANQQDENFVLEYAIELHRKGQYAAAAKLYESYSATGKDDLRVYIWLSDCYINIGETGKAIQNWRKVNYADSHTSIDFAIHTIYGNTNQIERRNKYKTAIAQGELSSLYPLLFLDENWQFDWWNSGAQKHFLVNDMELAKATLGATSEDFKILQAYVNVKKLEQEQADAAAIKRVLLNSNLILDNKPLPPFGSMASDLLRICFINGLLNEAGFYKSRGPELLRIAKETKDKEILNIYAYLQATVEGQVKPETDLLGWQEFKDERFAISYFMGKAEKNRYDDKGLAQALSDFPNSAKLYWVKTNCAKIEGKELKSNLIELIKREFKTLGSDRDHFSSSLNTYFGYLEVSD